MLEKLFVRELVNRLRVPTWHATTKERWRLGEKGDEGWGCW